MLKKKHNSQKHIYLKLEREEFSCTELSMSVLTSISTPSTLVAKHSAFQAIKDINIKKNNFRNTT